MNPFRVNRIQNDRIDFTISHLRKLYKELKPVLITDTDLVIPNMKVINYASKNLERDLQHINQNEEILIIAFNSDEKAVKICKYLKKKKLNFMSCIQYQPVAKYWNLNDIARIVLEQEHDEQVFEQYSKFSIPDFANLLQAIEITKYLNGAFVEIGVYMGSSASIALKYMKEIKLKRKCFFFDTFTGFTFNEAYLSFDLLWKNSHVVENAYDIVKRRLFKYNSAKDGLNVEIIKRNIITDKIPKEIKKIALCNIDVDMYESVLSALLAVAPLIVDGGVIIAEDPGHTPALTGARLALNEFIATDMGELFIPIYMESGQTFLIRK